MLETLNKSQIKSLKKLGLFDREIKVEALETKGGVTQLETSYSNGRHDWLSFNTRGKIYSHSNRIVRG